MDQFTLKNTLRDVARSRRTGELVIRKGSLSGRVFFVDGRVAWARCEGTPPNFLLDRLVEHNHLAREDLLSLVRECRTHGRQFGDYLVDLELMSFADMREALIAHVRDHLSAILSAPGQPRSLFVPVTRTFASRFIFELDEILVDASTPASACVSAALDSILDIDGAFAAAVVDHSNDTTLGTAGGGPSFDVELAATGNTEVVRAKLNVMKQLGVPGSIEDILITLGSQYHVIRPLRGNASLFLYMALSKEGSNLALARLRLCEIEEALSSDEGCDLPGQEYTDSVTA